jgi:hypothetical protein
VLNGYVARKVPPSCPAPAPAPLRLERRSRLTWLTQSRDLSAIARRATAEAAKDWRGLAKISVPVFLGG